MIHGGSAPTIASNDAATGLDSTSLIMTAAITTRTDKPRKCSERWRKVCSSFCIRIQHVRRNRYFVHRGFQHSGHDKC